MKNYHVLKSVIKLLNEVKDNNKIFFIYDLEYNEEKVKEIETIMPLSDYWEAMMYVEKIFINNIHSASYEQEDCLATYTMQRKFKGVYIEYILMCGIGDDFVIKKYDNKSPIFNPVG